MGFVVVLLGGRVDNQYAVVAVGSGVLCALLAGTILLLARSSRSAALVARYSAAAVGRVRRVDAAQWEHTAVSFGDRIRDRLSSGCAKAVAALAALLAVEASIFVVALRAVGVGAHLLPTAEAAGAYLVAYPLTMFPFSGIVLMDSALVELLATWAEPATEAELVAGVMLWRVVALLLPFLLGLLVLVHWRSRERGSIAGDTRSPS